MSNKMVRTQVYLPGDIYEELKRRADDEGITMATQIREALAEYIARSQYPYGGMRPEPPKHVLRADDPIWEMIGMAMRGHDDGSVYHDWYIYPGQ